MRSLFLMPVLNVQHSSPRFSCNAHWQCSFTQQRSCWDCVGSSGGRMGTFNFFLNDNSSCLLNMKSTLLSFHKPTAIILTIVKQFKLEQQAQNMPRSSKMKGLLIEFYCGFTDSHWNCSLFCDISNNFFERSIYKTVFLQWHKDHPFPSLCLVTVPCIP